MRKRQTLQTLITTLTLALLVAVAPAAAAQHVNYVTDDSAVVIKRTIPYPRAVERSPITSDRLSTTSTRLIDARRGLRPYSSVRLSGVECRTRRFVGYDDHFGISRWQDRPYSYSQRTPRTGITQYKNTGASVSVTRLTGPSVTSYRTDNGLLPALRRSQQNAVASSPAYIRIHNNRSARPAHSGAVLITSDGRVIQIGH